MIVRLLFFCCLCISLVITSATARTHPFHASIAEAEWNAKTKKLEIALWCYPIDLEKALSLRAKKPIDLDKTPDIDRRVVAYLNDVFLVKDTNGKRRKLEWVGKEIKVKAAWLYFEIPLENGLEGVRFSQRLYFEILEDQVNIINFRNRARKKRASLLFMRAAPERLFTWRKNQKS